MMTGASGRTNVRGWSGCHRGAATSHASAEARQADDAADDRATMPEMLQDRRGRPVRPGDTAEVDLERLRAQQPRTRARVLQASHVERSQRPVTLPRAPRSVRVVRTRATSSAEQVARRSATRGDAAPGGGNGSRGRTMTSMSRYIAKLLCVENTDD